MDSVSYRENRVNHQLFTVRIGGDSVHVTVTASASVVRQWLSSTLYFARRLVYYNCLVVGLGVQWTPGGHDPPPDTLQLCVGRRCLLFQLKHADGVPGSLRSFLNNPNHTFVGFWNYSDRRKLRNSMFQLEMYADPLDLRLLFENLAQASVPEIVQACLGFQVFQPRAMSRTMWRALLLSNEQVTYATVDVYCAFLIGRNFEVWSYY